MGGGYFINMLILLQVTAIISLPEGEIESNSHTDMLKYCVHTVIIQTPSEQGQNNNPSCALDR